MTKNVDKEVQVTLTYKEAAALANLLWRHVTCHVDTTRLRDKLLEKLPDDLSRRITRHGDVVRKLHDIQAGIENNCGVVLSGSDLLEIGEVLVNEALPDWEEWDVSMLETLSSDTLISVRFASGDEAEAVLARSALPGLAGWCVDPQNNITHIKRT